MEGNSFCVLQESETFFIDDSNVKKFRKKLRILESKHDKSIEQMKKIKVCKHMDGLNSENIPKKIIF